MIIFLMNFFFLQPEPRAADYFRAIMTYSAAKSCLKCGVSKVYISPTGDVIADVDFVYDRACWMQPFHLLLPKSLNFTGNSVPVSVGGFSVTHIKKKFQGDGVNGSLLMCGIQSFAVPADSPASYRLHVPTALNSHATKRLKMRRRTPRWLRDMRIECTFLVTVSDFPLWLAPLFDRHMRAIGPVFGSPGASYYEGPLLLPCEDAEFTWD